MVIAERGIIMNNPIEYGDVNDIMSDSELGGRFVTACARLYGYYGNFVPNIIHYALEYLLEHPEMIPQDTVQNLRDE